MATAHLSKSIELSPQFFTIVFADAFIFCKNPRDTLKETQLNAEEKKLLIRNLPQRGSPHELVTH